MKRNNKLPSKIFWRNLPPHMAHLQWLVAKRCISFQSYFSCQSQKMHFFSVILFLSEDFFSDSLYCSLFHLVRHYLLNTLHWQPMLNVPLNCSTPDSLQKIRASFSRIKQVWLRYLMTLWWWVAIKGFGNYCGFLFAIGTCTRILPNLAVYMYNFMVICGYWECIFCGEGGKGNLQVPTLCLNPGFGDGLHNKQISHTTLC